MTKEKKSSDKAAPKKTAAKKSPANSPAKKAAAKKPVAEKIEASVPVSSPQITTPHLPKTRPSAAELYDEIRRRAYDFYCERGGEHGSHEADWHRAEAEVRSKYRS